MLSGRWMIAGRRQLAQAKRWLPALFALILIFLPAPALSVARANATREFDIQARAYEYTPSIIRVQQGDRVRLTLTASDVMHGLVLDGYEIELAAGPRPTTLPSVEFVADRAGRFHFRCTLVCGPLHPFMVGELIVEPNPLGTLAYPLIGLVAAATLGLLLVRRKRLVPPTGGTGQFELTRFRPVRWVLGRRWLQFALTLPNLFFFVLILLASFFGTPVGNANFAIISVWIVWWAALKLILIPLGGRAWCSMCPIPIPGEWLDHQALIRKGRERAWETARRGWPQALRNIWLQNAAFLAVALFSAIILTRPWATGVVLLALFAGAALLSRLYGRRVFCRYVCPVGGFVALFSMAAPLEVRPKDPEVCRTHRAKDCLRGNPDGYGCPWMEYPGHLQRNAYCGLCTECFKTCPRKNMALNWRPFGSDLYVAQGRGLDEVFNVFIMLTCAITYSAVYLGPWGILKDMADLTTIPGFVLYAILFLAANLVLVPGLFYLAVGLGKGWADGRTPSRAEWLAIFEPLVRIRGWVFDRFSHMDQPSRSVTPQTSAKRPSRLGPPTVNATRHLILPASVEPTTGPVLPPLKRLAIDYGYALVPLGLTGWMAFTVSFFLTDVSYALPLISDPFGWGWNLFGTVGWEWIRLVPEWVPYLQMPILLVGLAWSIITVFRIAEGYGAERRAALKSLSPLVLFMMAITVVFCQLYV